MVNETGIDAAVDEASWKQAWEIAKEMNVAPPTVKKLARGFCNWPCCCFGPALNGESLFFLEMPFGTVLTLVNKQANPESILLIAILSRQLNMRKVLNSRRNCGRS